jgi:hypothetical protein
MPPTNLICHQAHVVSGAKSYPIYVSFCSANELAVLAAAPAFAPNTSNDALAASAATPPVRNWQRPLDNDRVNAMAQTFSQAGELMPNPVLLSENPNRVHGSVRISPYVLGSGNATPFWNVEIDPPGPNDQMPLWILDGQHRISALSKSSQASSAVPVVLLLDDGMNVYGPSIFAKLFAQVTTEARRLDKLHAEWLTYAFELGDYAPGNPSSSAARQSMTTVIELCKTPSFGVGPNPYLGQIQFNSDPTQVPHMTPQGFEMTCIEARQLIQQNYFTKQAAGAHLPPNAVAAEISAAYDALRSMVPQSPPTVYFGPPATQQVIVQHAFLIGVLAYLLAHGQPSAAGTSWPSILQSLSFHQTNWDFSWKESLNGQAGSRSTRIVREVMEEAFRTLTVPAGSSTLSDHLKGNAAKVTLQASYVTPTGRPRRSAAHPAEEFEFLGGAKTTFVTGGRTHLRVSATTTNVGELQIIDKSSGALQTQYPSLTRSGMVLDPSKMTNPLQLLVRMIHYGDTLSTAEITVQW